MTTAELRAYIRDPFLRRLLDAPDPVPETPEEAAARHADLERRIDADIAETAARPMRAPECGVIHFPQAMLDAFGLTEIDR